MKITLRKLTEEDFSNLYIWCQNKEVYEWFEQRKLSYQEIENKYKKKLNEQDLYIIVYNNTDIGLVQIYKYTDNLNIDILNNYKNTYEYDLFIGDNNYLNKGIGTNAIKIINNYIYNNYKCDSIILKPFKRNIRAIKCYLKNNFKEIYNYIDKDTIGNIEEILVLLNTKEVE